MDINFKKALPVIIPFIVFIGVISVNFFKPFGFFRESNPAMVCINADFWDHSNLLATHHVPVESYTFDSAAKPATQMWATVTSFGSGWFIAPYYFFKVLHLKADAVPLRIFSLLWFAVTLGAAWLLCRVLQPGIAGKTTAYLFLIFYIFTASSLWYSVQGYVHETAVLPFYFSSWIFFIKYLQTNKAVWLFALACCLFLAVQFDWLPCFQAAVMGAYLLTRKDKMQSGLAFAVPLISMAIGIAYIIYNYAQWATVPVYTSFLKDKFLSRIAGQGGLQIVPGLNYNFNIVLFYLTGYGLLIVLFVWYLIQKKVPAAIWLMIVSASLHHFVFWGFSTEHDHAVIKMGFPIAFAAATIITEPWRNVRPLRTSDRSAILPVLPFKKIAAVILIVVANIGIYFFLHNFYHRKGMYENPNFCYEAGTIIKQKFNRPDQYVFINTQGKYLLQIEFYAGKFYTLASSPAEAQKILHEKYPNGNGYFINGEKPDGLQSIIALK